MGSLPKEWCFLQTKAKLVWVRNRKILRSFKIKDRRSGWTRLCHLRAGLSSFRSRHQLSTVYLGRPCCPILVREMLWVSMSILTYWIRLNRALSTLSKLFPLLVEQCLVRREYLVRSVNRRLILGWEQLPRKNTLSLVKLFKTSQISCPLKMGMQRSKETMPNLWSRDWQYPRLRVLVFVEHT